VETQANHLRSQCTPYYPNERNFETTAQQEAHEQFLATRQGELERQRSDDKGSWQWDIETDITSWSEQLYRIAGRDPETAVPSFKEHSSFYTSDSWDQLTAATVRVLKTGQPYELELQMRRPDGTRRRVIGRGEAVRDARGNILRLCGTVEDITERKSQVIRGEREPEGQQNATYGITGRLIQSQEEDNTRIAKELRDNICQKLCLVAVRIQGLPPTPELTEKTGIRIDELWRDTAGIVAEIVQISHHLHPSALDLIGLPLAIQGFCREFSSRTNIPVECSWTDILQERIGNEVALSFFRILQDALGNVAKHSHASNVIVELIGRSRELLLRVSDNGGGVDLQKTNGTTGLGFIRMKERLRFLGGELAVWSTPTQGTRVEARAPMRGSLQ